MADALMRFGGAGGGRGSSQVSRAFATEFLLSGNFSFPPR